MVNGSKSGAQFGCYYYSVVPAAATSVLLLLQQLLQLSCFRSFCTTTHHDCCWCWWYYGFFFCYSLARHSCTLAVRYGEFMQWCKSLCRVVQTVVHPRREICRHTVAYDTLPDWFIAFDLYSTHEQMFLSTRARDQILAQHAPSLARIHEVVQSVIDVLHDHILMLSTYSHRAPIGAGVFQAGVEERKRPLVSSHM